MEDIVKTNNTAKPIPVAEEIFLDTPKYGQIPSVRERTIFCEVIKEDSLVEKLPETAFLQRERSGHIWKSLYPLR